MSDSRKAGDYYIKPGLTYRCRKEARTRSREHHKGKDKWYHQGKNLRKLEQAKKFKERENVASPTVLLEGLFSTLAIDAYEGIEVAIFDVPGAYLHVDMPKYKLFLLKLRGTFVDIMCQINPEHKNKLR